MMKGRVLYVTISALFFTLTSCAPLTPELVAALAGDAASICISSNVSGGAGGGGLMAGAVTGGWGSGAFTLCRSNYPGAKVNLRADGAISIEHQ